MLNYNELAQLHSKARNKATGYGYGNNLKIVKTAKGYGIKHHNTVIADICSNNTVTISNGGYYSVTTKKNINRFLPNKVYVFQAKGDWFYRINGTVIEYSNNVIFSNDGEIVAGLNK